MIKEYDFFVSHSHHDTDRVRGLVEQWQSWGHNIFADFEDPKLIEASRKQKMDSDTSEYLRQAIGGCKVFIFIASEHSASSRWMPWELGLAHGMVGRVHLYLLDDTAPTDFEQREYLQLYNLQCFNNINAQVYLRKAVDQARNEDASPAQIEKAHDMGRRGFQALINGNYDEVYKRYIKEPSAQGNATVDGFKRELSSESDSTQSISLWDEWNSSYSGPTKNRT